VSAPLDTLRAGKPGCPSDLALDRLHHGELAADPAEALRRHLGGCADCAARLAERTRGFDAVPGADPRRVLAGIRRGLDAPAPRARWPWLAALAGVAASLALLPLLRPGGPASRTKGGLALHVYRARGERAEAMISGDRFAPGDRLRFVVDLPSAGAVRVVGVEARGALYTAWPQDPAAPSTLGPGEGIALPGAVALDAQPGRETLYLVHCPAPLGPPVCAAAAGEAPRCTAGCALSPFVLEKGP
jgi:hypothetical protein